MPKTQASSGDYSPLQRSGQRQLRRILIALTVFTLANLLLSASLAALLGGCITLIMVWGIHTGDYGLRKALVVFLLVYAAVNLIVLLLSAMFASPHPLALFWLGLYSLALVACALLLRRPAVKAWLEVAPQPSRKEKKIHFFHGGWRDL